jgi:thiosulfate reductase cytochrome b subunit
MGIRKKRNLLIFFIFPIGGFSLLLLGTLHWIFIVMFLLFTMSIGYLTSKILCPKCSNPAGLHKHKIGNIEVNMWSPFTKKRCDYCGKSFV